MVHEKPARNSNSTQFSAIPDELLVLLGIMTTTMAGFEFAVLAAHTACQNWTTVMHSGCMYVFLWQPQPFGVSNMHVLL